MELVHYLITAVYRISRIVYSLSHLARPEPACACVCTLERGRGAREVVTSVRTWVHKLNSGGSRSPHLSSETIDKDATMPNGGGE
eukprot:scaffold59941_cov46-Cyclotella_meneghiniana.AAC.2